MVWGPGLLKIPSFIVSDDPVIFCLFLVTGSRRAEFWLRIQGVCRERVSGRSLCTRKTSQESQIHRHCQVKDPRLSSQESQIHRHCQVKSLKVVISRTSNLQALSGKRSQDCYMYLKNLKSTGTLRWRVSRSQYLVLIDFISRISNPQALSGKRSHDCYLKNLKSTGTVRWKISVSCADWFYLKNPKFTGTIR